jgi:hypothetical protein
MMPRYGDLVRFRKPHGPGERKGLREFHPTRPASETEHYELNLSGGILGAIGGTRPVKLA